MKNPLTGLFVIFSTVEGKFDPVQAMKPYGGRGKIEPLSSLTSALDEDVW
jgi:hypothetical protein